MYRALSNAHTITHVHPRSKTSESSNEFASESDSQSELRSNSETEAKADCDFGAGPQLTTRIAGTASESEAGLLWNFDFSIAPEAITLWPVPRTTLHAGNTTLHFLN